MNKEEFIQLVKENIKGYLSQDYQKGEVLVKDFMFGGEKHLCFAVVIDQKTDIPALDLERYYEKIKGGTFPGAVLKELGADYQELCQYEKSEHVVTMDIEEFLGHLHVAVLNHQIHRKRLADIPCMKMNDLAVIPMLRLPSGKSIVVDQEMAASIQIAGEQLLGLAVKNHTSLLKPVLIPVSSILEGGPRDIPLDDRKALPQNEAFYVLTNVDHVFGAAAMVDKELLNQLGEKLGDDFYIIPTNINELMIAPKKNIKYPSTLKEFIKTSGVNSRSSEDFLSDNLYLYHTKIREVCLCGGSYHREAGKKHSGHDER